MIPEEVIQETSEAALRLRATGRSGRGVRISLRKPAIEEAIYDAAGRRGVTRLCRGSIPIVHDLAHKIAEPATAGRARVLVGLGEGKRGECESKEKSKSEKTGDESVRKVHRDIIHCQVLSRCS